MNGSTLIILMLLFSWRWT